MVSRNLWRQARRLCGVAAMFGVLMLPLTAAAGVVSTTAGAVFLRKIPSAILNDQTNSMSVGTDGAGGMHAAFVNSYTDTNGNFNAYYEYCAPGQDCANAANWAVVNLLTEASSAATIDAAQIAVNSQGHPRVVIVTTDNGGLFPDHYNYAACDSGCTSHANWTITDVADLTIGNNANIFNGNKHFFALDAQGRPAFVLDNGTNYEIHFCNTACTNAVNWSSLTLNGTSDTSSGDNTPALVFNSASQPRMLAPLQNPNTLATSLLYWECDTNDCGTNANSWLTVTMVSSFISVLPAAYSSLRLTQSGQPRFAYYGAPGGAAESLYYFWCQSACTTSAHWTYSDVGLVPAAGFETSGQEPDLALDSQDHPRLSFQTLDHTLGNGLGYAWCDLSCESGSSIWQNLLADSNDQLNADWNRVSAFGCTSRGWIGAPRSALVLDTAGNPRIGYDAEHVCGDPGLSSRDYESVRFVYFRGNALPGPYRLYLPSVRK